MPKKQTLKLTLKQLHAKMRDPKWRINNLYAIKPKAGGVAKFKLNPAQKLVLALLWFKNYILKSRQQGVSTFSVIYFLDALLFNANKTAGVIDITDKSARRKLAMAKTAYKHMDDPLVHPDTWELGAMVKKSVKLIKGQDAEFPEELVFSNGSAFWAGVSFRGSTLQFALFTEMGKIAQSNPEKAKEIIEGAANSMHKGSIAIYETTHEGGRAGIAYDQCIAAMQGPQDIAVMSEGDAKFIFIPWYVDPDNTESTSQGTTWESYLTTHTNVETVDGPFDAHGYFQNCLTRGVTLTPEQKAWYINKRRAQGFGMFKEHPTFDDEPFLAPTIGAIYGHAISRLRDRGRIHSVDYLPAAPVYTFWDLGAPRNTMIWHLQEVDGRVRCLRCDYGIEVESTGEYVAHLNSLGYKFGGHFLPHDGLHKQKGGMTFKRELEEAGLKNVQGIQRISDVHIRINRLKGYLPEFEFDQELCKQGLVALEAYCWKEDSANPGTFLDKPTDKWPSHACVAEGTLVMMHDGFEKFVEDIQPGEAVWTPCGVCSVTGVHDNGVAEVAEVMDGLWVTGNHKLFTEEGLVTSDELRYDTEVWKLSSLVGRHIAFKRDTTPTGRFVSIVRSGKRTMAQSLTNTISTIRMGIASIIDSLTWSASPQQNMRVTMPKQTSGYSQGHPPRHFWRKLSQRPRRGTGAQRGTSGTANTGSKSGRISQWLRKIVSFVGRNSPPRSRQGRGSAKGSALSANAEALCSALEKRALSAGQPLSIRRQRRIRSIVPNLATQKLSLSYADSAKRQVRVFDLTVDGAHCYFAAGVLVSNSDALGYYAEARMRRMIESISAFTGGRDHLYEDQHASAHDQDIGLSTWGAQEKSLPSGW